MNQVTILSEAKQELLDALSYYESKAQRLGLDFVKEVRASIERIKRFPESYAKRSDGTQRCLINRFPYLVVYLYQSHHVWIVAIAHCKRKPLYWKDRDIHKGYE